MTEQERKKMFEDFEDFNKSRQKSEDDYYSQLEDTLNISKQIGDQYKNQQHNIGKINGDISKTLTKIQAQKVAIEKNRELYKEVGERLEVIKKREQALVSLHMQNQRKIDETKKIREESLAIQSDIEKKILSFKKEEQKVTLEISKLEESALKNKAAQEINTKALLAHRKEQRTVEQQLKGIEDEIAEAQRAAIHDGIVDQEKYNLLLKKHENITKNAVDMRLKEAALVNDGQKYAKRESSIQQEILNKRQRIKGNT